MKSLRLILWGFANQRFWFSEVVFRYDIGTEDGYPCVAYTISDKLKFATYLNSEFLK